MRRVKLTFAGREVEFADREAALRQLERVAERGNTHPLVMYGPEGCGKTALLRQARAILEEYGYHVVYVDPLAREVGEVLQFTPSIRDIVLDVVHLIPEPYSRIVDVAISVAGHVMRKLSRPKIAVLMDDIFQAVGVDKAEQYVKALLNLIEYPPSAYEKAVVLVTSSEGVTAERVGRHRWADMYVMWNMARDGFAQLYEQLPGPKPSLDEAWRLTGGSPEMLIRLFERDWDVDGVVLSVLGGRRLDDLIGDLDHDEKRILEEAVWDPDVLRARETAELRRVLAEKNLIIRVMLREPRLWVDVPPPERDVELGIGRYYAWQTPLHREAVRRALEFTGP